MMKIQLNDEMYLKCGLELASEGNYLGALKMFNHCDSYEAEVNRVLMMYCANEIFFGNEYFYRLYSKYGQTHNVFCDINDNLGYLKNCIKKIQIPTVDKKRKQGKIDGDKNLLFDFVSFDFDDYESFFLELGEEYECETESWFADIKTDDYQMMLLQNESNDFGDSANRQRSKRKLMQQKTDFLPTNLFQLHQYLRQENYEKAEVLALELYQHPDLRCADMFNIAVLFHVMDKNRDIVSQLLYRVLENCTLSPSNIDHCIFIANNYLEDLNLAKQFAQLVLLFDDARTEILKGCLTVFFNLGDMQTCKEILVRIFRLFPEDIFSTVSLEYLKTQKKPKNHLFLLSNLTIRHIDIPAFVLLEVFREWGKFKEKGSENTKNLFHRQLLWLKTLLYSMPTHLFSKKNHERYNIFFDATLEMLDSMDISENILEFEKLAKDYCCQFGNDPLICGRLWFMLAGNSTAKIFVQNAYVKYFFDMALLNRFDTSSEICRVMCLLATFVEVNKNNIAEFEKNYLYLQENHADLLSKATGMQVVFYLIAETLSLSQIAKRKLNKEGNATLHKAVKNRIEN